ncbi:MAG: flagellar filament capping protein FliD [Gemmataceae bacterium]|nr:flagellar filament capping protein FliD [Gemmataceae bacterium]
MSSISSLSGNSLGLSFSGLASGIDSASLVDRLLAVERLKVTSLQAKQATLSNLQGTFGSLRSALADLQAKAGQLARSVAGPFEGKKATASDESLLKAAAGSTATPGQYSFKVAALAASHQVASLGLADAASPLKTGTLQFKVGGATTTIAVDGTNNTLQEVASAINASGAGIQATVISDGSATPYRLLLASKKTGTTNAIQVTNNLTGGSGASLNLDPSTQTIQQATDAQIVLGSGAGALTVTSASNTVDSVVPGVTLSLLGADAGKTVTVTVGNDAEAAKQAVTDFVDSYNQVASFIGSRSTYDKESQRAGVLLGNHDARVIEDSLSATVGAAVRSASQQAARLSSIGVAFTDKGELKIDQAKLDSALAGSGLDGVRKLFALTGGSDSAGVSFLLGTTRTQGTADPVGVKVTQAARQASLAAARAVAPSVAIDSSNDTLALSVNGKSMTVQMASGTYDAAGLAAELQAGITAAAGTGGPAVKVAQSGGVLSITTAAFGTSANVTVSSSPALAALGFTAGQSATGQNVAGHFLVNGVQETATGSGQVLIGGSGNARTDGLQVKVTLDPSQLNADPNMPEARVTVSRGLASQLDRVLNSFLDPVRGRMKTIDEGFQRQIDDLQASITRDNALIGQRRDVLVRRFADMETAVSRLRSLGATIASQLAGLGSLSSGSSSGSPSNSSSKNT